MFQTKTLEPSDSSAGCQHRFPIQCLFSSYERGRHVAYASPWRSDNARYIAGAVLSATMSMDDAISPLLFRAG